MSVIIFYINRNNSDSSFATFNLFAVFIAAFVSNFVFNVPKEPADPDLHAIILLYSDF